LENPSSLKEEVGRDWSAPVGFRFHDVSFQYPGAEGFAISGVSFEIFPGSQVALMGPSGSGKSTIADLICQVVLPTQGLIEIDSNTKITGDSSQARRVSYVPQRPGLVSGTILENVALGENLENVRISDVIEALQFAQLLDLVDSLPEGVNTTLGKLQDGLSGGQMQRLGLARALYSKPSLLVMDEATSALDAESEAEIQKALELLRGKVTVVLIAHRLNTIQHADKVILVEEGGVKDFGTFQELIARNPSVERVVDLMRINKA
jgi:ATP-binding cassette subfamily C protein